jgi:hypothetical protein
MTTNEGDRPASPQERGSAGEAPIASLPEIIVRTADDERVSAAPPAVRSAPYDPRPHTTKLRGWLAIGLTVVLGVTIVALFDMAWHHDALKLTIEQVNGFATPIISTEVALLGTALGFYFGDRSTP